jgi:hypothetical protein
MGFQALQYQGVLHKELPCANCNDLFPNGISHAPGVEVQNQRVRPPKSRFNGPQKATETQGRASLKLVNPSPLVVVVLNCNFEISIACKYCLGGNPFCMTSYLSHRKVRSRGSGGRHNMRWVRSRNTSEVKHHLAQELLLFL